MRIPAILLLLTALAAPGPAPAQSLEDYDYENLAFRGVGLELGGIWPLGVERELLLGARADLGYLGPDVRIVPRITFWSSSLREGVVDELRENVLRLCREPESDCVREFGEVRVSDLALSLDAHYTWPAWAGLVPYTGAGLGIHLLNGQGELIDDTFVEDLLDAITPGINLIAGTELPLGSHLRLFTEARGVLGTDLQYAALVAGGSWTIPTPPAGRAP